LKRIDLRQIAKAVSSSPRATGQVCVFARSPERF